MATREFKFSNKETELIIEGNIYKINPFDEEITQRQRAFAQQAERILNESGNDNEIERLSTELCRSFIDGVLGEGAAEAIFKNRKLVIYDLYDVINYINNEIRAEREKRLSVYTAPPRYNANKSRKRRRK